MMALMATRVQQDGCLMIGSTF
uniref:Uncharacterized protein n=1 Tax=Tetranychus urticae TaxID=32264 RepID=T1K0G6_TETUR